MQFEEAQVVDEPLDLNIDVSFLISNNFFASATQILFLAFQSLVPKIYT
jgi:hypothetical protein